jgi:hypothetical protein
MLKQSPTHGYPYYSFGTFTPDGKWNFILQNPQLLFQIHPEFGHFNDMKELLRATEDHIIERKLSAEIHKYEIADPLDHAYAYWEREVKASLEWSTFAELLIPHVILWDNASDELWSAWTVVLRGTLPGFTQYRSLFITSIIDDKPVFDPNAPMNITGMLVMDIADTGIA